MFILVYCADFNRDDTYHDVLLSMNGKRAQQVSALSIMLTCYGINITFLVIIGDQYDRIFNSLLEPEFIENNWWLDRKFTIFLTAVLFIWPMCYAQRLDFLRHASILGMFAMLYVAFLTVYEHYMLDEATIESVLSRVHAAEGSAQASQLPPANATPAPSETVGMMPEERQIKWFEPLAVVPVLCFAYQTHEVIVPVYACMKERHIGSFMKATFFGLVILFMLYNLVGAFGYLTFGSRVGADIMSYYDAKDPVVVVGVLALVIKFITTYPPLMFCGRSAFDGLYAEIRSLSTSEFKEHERVRRYVISTLWFLTTVALAAFAPDISITLQLLGSMASINVFVFPGMCLWSLTRRLRRARLALLMGEAPEGFNASQQQRARDYYLISGSYFGAAMKKNAALMNQCRQRQQQQQQQALSGSVPPLVANQINGTGIAIGAGQLEGSPANPSNAQRQFTATFATLLELENNLVNCNGNGPPISIPNGCNANAGGDGSVCLQNSLNCDCQQSTTGSILEKFGASIAPTTVAQMGISQCTATGLYLFAAFLVVFGIFIFLLELFSVFGLV